MLRVEKLKKFKNNFPILVGNKAISNHLCASLIKEISSSETFDDLIMGGRSRINKGSKNFKKYINKSNINKTYVYGNYTKHTFNKLKPQMRGKILNNKLEILNLIKKQLPNNSFLMIKGSNSTGLNKIIKNL